MFGVNLEDILIHSVTVNLSDTYDIKTNLDLGLDPTTRRILTLRLQRRCII
jgi:hypothetical protein